MSAQSDDPRVVYADIIDLPHWRSPTRRHMSEQDRAAQFAPFAALTGYEDMIGEEARQTGRQIQLEEEALDRLSDQMNRLAERIAAGERPAVNVTWFIPDERKTGGRYETARETVRQIDRAERLLILCRREGPAGRYASISLDRILYLEDGTEEQ